MQQLKCVCVAPAEGQTPLDFILDANVEVLAFLAKFPYGIGGFSDEHDILITPKKYFIQRQLNHDKRFAAMPVISSSLSISVR